MLHDPPAKRDDVQMLVLASGPRMRARVIPRRALPHLGGAHSTHCKEPTSVHESRSPHVPEISLFHILNRYRSAKAVEAVLFQFSNAWNSYIL